MPQGYSLYVIGHDGQIKKRHDFSCENDAEAKDRAEQLMDAHDIELWQETRRVVIFRPQK